VLYFISPSKPLFDVAFSKWLHGCWCLWNYDALYKSRYKSDYYHYYYYYYYHSLLVCVYYWKLSCWWWWNLACNVMRQPLLSCSTFTWVNQASSKGLWPVSSICIMPDMILNLYFSAVIATCSVWDLHQSNCCQNWCDDDDDDDDDDSAVALLVLRLLSTDSWLWRIMFSHTRSLPSIEPELILVYWQSAIRWLFKSFPAVGCHYFPPGLQSSSQPKNITVFDQYQVILLIDRGT